MKHLLKLGGMTPEEILHILDVADEYKQLHKDGVDPKDLQGKAVALVFAKNSTRTRTSLEVGIYQMGGLGTYLSASDLQTARGEPVQDTARVLGRYYDAIVCRTYKQTTLDMLAKYSGIPVVSGMTDYAHPLQVLTDLMTVRERKGTLAGLKAGFVGDGYNMANSVIVGCLAVGMTVTIACPKGYRPAADVLMLAKQYGDKFTLTNDPDEAARDADVLFTDVWVSMGMEREAEQRRRDFTGFTLDAARMALAKPDCMVQHPLPAHRGEEIAPDVLEAHADEIFDEAENRIYVEKAALAVLLAGLSIGMVIEGFVSKAYRDNNEAPINLKAPEMKGIYWMLLIFAVWDIARHGHTLALPETKPETAPPVPAPQPKWTRREVGALLALTAATAVLSFSYLGSRTAPQTKRPQPRPL